MVVIEKAYNISVKSSFLQASREELIVKREEELGDVKCYNAGMALLELPYMNKVSKVYFYISSGSLSDVSQLIRVQETIG